MKRTLITLSSCVVLAAAVLTAQRGPAAKPFEIYVVDVEGGKADLIVAPNGQTALIDTGNNGPLTGPNRDVDRIMEVATAAGVTKLDYLLSTHYHTDHVGGLQALVTRLPVTTFLDHGAPAQPDQVQGFQAAYAEIWGKAKHQVLKVGDTIPIPGINWRIVTSGGELQKTPLPGVPAGPNPNCEGVTRSTMNNGGEENDHSVGSLITIGAFRLADFGDLTGGKEFDLVCPSNPLGTVDLFMASNHGTNNANFPFFIHSLSPRVSIAQNAAGKGASVQYLQALKTTPGFLDTWLLHWGNAAGTEWNPPESFIANGAEPEAIAAAVAAAAARGAGGGGAPGGGGGGGGRGGGGGAPGGGAPAAAPGAPAAPQAPAAGAPAAAPGAGAPGGRAGGAAGGRGGGQPPHTPAYYIKVSVQADGTFTVMNSRNNFSKTYAPRTTAAAAPAATRGTAAAPAGRATAPATGR